MHSTATAPEVLVVTLDPPSATTQGDQVYRCLAPSAALAQTLGVYTVCATWLTPLAHVLAEAADVLVLCQSIDMDYLPLLARRRAAKRLTVVEINDNFLDPQPHNPVASFYRNPVNRSLALQLARSADRLQFSAPGLVTVFGALNTKHKVIPNALVKGDLPASGQPVGRVAPRTGPMRLGWGGSGGHLDDLRWVMPCLQAVFAHDPKVTLHIMGPRFLQPLFAWVPEARLVFQPGGSLADYKKFLSGLDVGIAPLVDTPFNRCRSDVKYMEYTMAGVPGVYSAGPAYGSSVCHGVTGLLADSPTAFTQCILRLLGSPGWRAQLTAAASKHIVAQRTGAQLAAERWQFWAPAGPVQPDTQARPSSLDRLPAGSQQAPRHWVLPMGRLEKTLYEGLVQGQSRAAVQALQTAARQAPYFYLPHLYLGHAQRDAAQAHVCLQQAHSLAPASMATRYSLAKSFRAAGSLGAAAQLARCTQAEIAADCAFAPMTELAGRLAADVQQQPIAAAHYLAALAQNAWYRPPAVRLAQLYIASGKNAAARRLLEENLEQGQASWLEHFLLGQVASRAAAWSQARRHFETAAHCGAPNAQIAPSLAQACLRSGDLVAARSALGRLEASHGANT